jgi:hypothetical protein
MFGEAFTASARGWSAPAGGWWWGQETAVRDSVMVIKGCLLIR